MASKRLTVSRLTGVEKAAILLLSFGDKLAAGIFDNLDDSEVRKICRCMMQMEHIPREVAEQVINQFKQEQDGMDGFFVQGQNFVQKAIEHSQNEDRKALLGGHLNSGLNFKPLETIAMMDPRMVASLLEREHPQTVALILSTQTPEHTSKVIEYLPNEQQPDIVFRIARISSVSPDVINLVEESLRNEIGRISNQDQHRVGGIDKVVEVLGRMKGKDGPILNKLCTMDAKLVEAIKKKMFTFDDLVYLDDRSIQFVLREIEQDTLALALKTANEDMKEKIFSNVSSRAAEMIQDELDNMPPQKLSDVETAQQAIIDIAMKLEEDGAIMIPGRGMNNDELV